MIFFMLKHALMSSRGGRNNKYVILRLTYFENGSQLIDCNKLIFPEGILYPFIPAYYFCNNRNPLKISTGIQYFKIFPKLFSNVLKYVVPLLG